jgi:hypothetical protein
VPATSKVAVATSNVAPATRHVALATDDVAEATVQKTSALDQYERQSITTRPLMSLGTTMDHPLGHLMTLPLRPSPAAVSRPLIPELEPWRRRPRPGVNPVGQARRLGTGPCHPWQSASADAPRS